MANLKMEGKKMRNKCFFFFIPLASKVVNGRNSLFLNEYGKEKETLDIKLDLITTLQQNENHVREKKNMYTVLLYDFIYIVVNDQI